MTIDNKRKKKKAFSSLKPFRFIGQMLDVRASRGIAALIAVITITLFLFSVTFLVVNLGGSVIFKGQYGADAARAQFVADAGVQDALIKKARDQSYTGTYSISDSDWTVDISVTGTSSVVIVATSTITNRTPQTQRTIQADVTLDADGKVLTLSKQNL